jgi:hypothetical protein
MPVPHLTDESDANTLPDPELNPLLNPLLAAHMGRWAEVYFTNPPEKRGQAISELLRELENIPPPRPPSIQPVSDEKRQRTTETREAVDSSSAAVEPVLACGACAYNNSAGHEFCGMCGAPLQVSAEMRLQQVAEGGPVAGASRSEHEPSPAVSASADSGRHDALEPTGPPPERNFSTFAVESEPVPYRQRLYMRAALAILLAALGYTVWREAEAPPIAPSLEPTFSQAPAQSAAATSARQPSAMRQDKSDAKPAPVTASSSPMADEQSGAAELATAEKYLKGGQDMPRDSTEAAQWLWKAVRKRNLAATMALSDLYLRGDGVPKNCDQARLLLDAAARKGGTAATERLGDLQAFGCE